MNILLFVPDCLEGNIKPHGDNYILSEQYVSIFKDNFQRLDLSELPLPQSLIDYITSYPVKNNLEKLLEQFTKNSWDSTQNPSTFTLFHQSLSAELQVFDQPIHSIKTHFTANRLWDLFYEHEINFSSEDFYKMVHNIFGKSIQLSYFNETLNLTKNSLSPTEAATLDSLQTLAHIEGMRNIINDYLIGEEENNTYRDTVKYELNQVLGNMLSELVADYLEEPDINANSTVENKFRNQYLNHIKVNSYALNAYKTASTKSTKKLSRKNNYGFPASVSDVYSITDMPQDGSCFFHALFYQLKNLNLLKQHDLPLDQFTAVSLIRERSLNHIRDNFTRYANFTGDFETFLKNNSQHSDWADHTLINAAAEAFNVCIHILRNDGQTNIINDNIISSPTPIYVGYRVGRHYYSLEPRNTTYNHASVSSSSSSSSSSSNNIMDEDNLTSLFIWGNSSSLQSKNSKEDKNGDNDAQENLHSDWADNVFVSSPMHLDNSCNPVDEASSSTLQGKRPHEDEQDNDGKDTQANKKAKP